jgi:hypothetical protein
MPVDYQPPTKVTTPLSLVCDGVSHSLDVGKWTPSRSGLTLSAIYCNVDRFVLADPDRPGRLRLFMRRAAWRDAPIDDTFFHDLWIPPGRSAWGTLHTASFFEWADGGRTLSWRYEADGFASMVLATRFVKAASIY